MVQGRTERLGRLRSHWMVHWHVAGKYWNLRVREEHYRLVVGTHLPLENGTSVQNRHVSYIINLLLCSQFFVYCVILQKIEWSPKGFDLSLGLKIAIHFSPPHGQLQSDFRRSMIMVLRAISMIYSQ
jgi:hypothetical protein